MSCLEKQEWESVPRDPDLEADLGYDLKDLDVLQSGGSSKYMILPHDEELIRDETFIVIEEAGVQDLSEWR